MARADELFTRALAVDGSEREALLATECDGDDALRADVESLLAAHEAMGDFMDRPAAGALGTLVPRLEPGESVGGYRVERLIDEGGSGAVYEAIQANPERRVALKVMRAGPASEADRARFAREAQILARLTHPAVATIYEAGVEETAEGSLSWFALEYVEGSRTLLDHASAKELSLRDRLALFARICDAIHHGHQQGLLHRDVKPGNVLIDAAGLPKVIDFGIARTVEDTAAAEVAGTPAYMSPEQAAGGPPDVRSDVFSLGVVLDELLAEASESSLPADVRSIVRKARAHDPEERYVSAAALGEDVRRYLAREPVAAHAHGPLYRLGKFARRQRLAFGALLGVVAVSIAAAVVSTRLAIDQERARREAEFQSYVANIAAASAALRIGDVADARRWLAQAPPYLRGWEWRHLTRRVDLSTRTIAWPGVRIWTGVFSPDGSLLAAVGLARHDPEERAIRIWNRESGTPLRTFPIATRARSLAFSHDGSLLALGYESGLIEIQETRTGEMRHRLNGHVQEVNAMVFDAEGERLLSVSRDKTMRIWSLRDGAPPRTLLGHEDRVICVCLSPDGSHALTGGREGTIRIWDLETGNVRVVEAHARSVEGVDWSRDGGFFVSACRDGTAAIWDATSLRRTATLRGHEDVARDIAIAPDGRSVATASYDRTVRLWDVKTGAERACFRGHDELVSMVTFTPDSGRVTSISRDGTIKEWPVAGHKPVPAMRGHADVVRAVVFGPEERIVVTGSLDRTIRLWDAATGELRRTLWTGRFAVHSLLCANGRLHAGFTDGQLRTWSLPDGALLWEAPGGACIASLEDGSRLAIRAQKSEVVILDGATGAVLDRWRVQEGTDAIAATANGRRIVTSTRLGEVAVWSSDGALIAQRRTNAYHMALAISPDDATVAVGDYAGNIGLYDIETLNRRGELSGHTSISSLVYWPDGRRLAAGGRDGTIRLWDPERGQTVAVFQGHHRTVHSLAVSRDGRRLLFGAGRLEAPGSVAKIWEAD